MTPPPLDDCLSVLTALADERASPAAALVAVAALRARHPGCAFEVIWDEEAGSGRFHFDLLIDTGAAGTIALALTPPDALPFPLRGLQRWKEMEVARIDGRTVWMHEVTTYFDAIWGDADLCRKLVDHCLIQRELERSPVEVSDAALQRAVDAFRAEHGLDTAAATEAWLADHAITLPDLEDGLAGRIALPRLRRRIAGDAHAAFTADRARFDAIDVIAFPAAAAAALTAEIRGGAGFYAIAERELAGGGGRPGAAGLMFATCRRHELVADEPLVEGAVVAARISGAGPYVAWIRGVRGATWDDATRAAIEEVVFAAWLADQRAHAHVEWNWGTR